MCDGAAVSVFRKSVFFAAALHVAVTAAPEAQGAESGEINSVLIIDSSNSMWSQIRGRGRYDIARRVLAKDFARYSGRFDLGVIAYGHRYKKSCSDIQTIMPIGEIDARKYSRAIRRFTPKGKTPISRALFAAVKETKAGSPPDNIILLSDGLDNCGQNPCDTATTLKSLNADLQVHVIALSVPRQRQNRLSCIAKNTQGTFITAKNETTLASATETIFELVAKRNEELLARQELVVAQSAPEDGETGLLGPEDLSASPAATTDPASTPGTTERTIPLPKANPKAATLPDASPILTTPELIGEPQPFSLPPVLSQSETSSTTGQAKEIATRPGAPAAPEMLIAPAIVSATEIMPAQEEVAAPDQNAVPQSTEAEEDVEALDFATPFEMASLAVTAVPDVNASPRAIQIPQIAVTPPVSEPPATAEKTEITTTPADRASTDHTTTEAATPEVKTKGTAPTEVEATPEVAVAQPVTATQEIKATPRLDAIAQAAAKKQIMATSEIADEPSPGSPDAPRAVDTLAALDITAPMDAPPPPPAPATAESAPEKPATENTTVAIAPVTTGALSSEDPSSPKPPVKINIGDRPIPKLPDEVRPTFLINEESVEAGEEGLTLRGKISSATATITRPIDWAAYKIEDAKADRWRKIADVEMAEASISLPPGQYVVRASYGAARAAKVLEVKPGKRIDATFILNAGGLRILPGLAFLDTPKDIFAKHWVFGASANENGKRRLFAQSTAIGEVVRLNSGTYTLVSRFGNANAVVETNITIRPGTLTEVEINHKVGIVSFRISAPSKTPAGDDAVKWQLVDDSGIIIVRADGPEMTQILAPGNYRVMVEHRGKSYTSEFMVEIGETKAVEIATK